jgi:hypothetical protein
MFSSSCWNAVAVKVMSSWCICLVVLLMRGCGACRKTFARLIVLCGGQCIMMESFVWKDVLQDIHIKLFSRNAHVRR